MTSSSTVDHRTTLGLLRSGMCCVKKRGVIYQSQEVYLSYHRGSFSWICGLCQLSLNGSWKVRPSSCLGFQFNPKETMEEYMKHVTNVVAENVELRLEVHKLQDRLHPETLVHPKLEVLQLLAPPPYIRILRAMWSFFLNLIIYRRDLIHISRILFVLLLSTHWWVVCICNSWISSLDIDCRSFICVM